MYNTLVGDILKILFCAFAVFGVYSLIREALLLFAKRPRLFIGVYLDASMPRQRVENDMALAAEVAARCKYTHTKPVILQTADVEIDGCAPYEIYQKKGYGKREV